MYFNTFNHYSDDDIIYDDAQCIICWDKSTTNNNIYKMQILLSSSIYYTSCTCNGHFHDKCLLKWIYKTQSCPICRIKFDINVEEKLPLTFNIFKILKYICIILIIRILYNIIFDIQYEVEKKLQNEQCDLL